MQGRAFYDKKCPETHTAKQPSATNDTAKTNEISTVRNLCCIKQ